MNKFNFSNLKNILAGTVVALSLFVFGIYVGSANQPEVDKIIGIKNKTNALVNETDFNSFWKVWNALNEKHPDAKNVSDQDKIYGAISGLVNSLDDPYTTFFDPRESTIFEEDIAGNFSGVGMEVGIKDKILTVIAPLKNTPAEKAGIESGDKILKINDTETLDLSIEQAIKLIRGEKGTAVTLTIYRDSFEKAKEIKIVRDIINVPVLDTEVKENNIFVIKLYSFSANSTKLFRNALEEFSKTKSDKLIIDLRSNPGGYLDASVDIASWFLPKGKVIVTEDYSLENKKRDYRSIGYNVFSDKLKLVVLINEGSASASEILAGALQDYKKAILVGQKSFGKGSVQEVVKVTPETLLKVTVANWLTPLGHSISKKGLTPDYVVEKYKKDTNNTQKEDTEVKKDLQMEKAVELLKNWPGIKK